MTTPENENEIAKKHRTPGRGYAKIQKGIVRIAGRVFRKVHQADGKFRLVREQHRIANHNHQPRPRRNCKKSRAIEQDREKIIKQEQQFADIDGEK